MVKFDSHSHIHRVRVAMTFLLVLGAIFAIARSVGAQADDPSPPSATVKLIFIHHSCGENWLTDDHGGLGRALGENNYFVSDTNYGWGPDGIGDRTDITDWPEWFAGPSSDRYLTALYAESGQSSWYTRNLPDPGGENQIVMFKSCFPNSNLEGSPDDPPARGEWLTVGNAKAIYNELLAYFSTRPDKLFVAVTAPPVQDPTFAANARAFNTWLVTEWLNGYEGANVAVFDFYNVLTDPDNHHRFHDGAIEYITNQGGDTLYYPTDGDDHPSPAGNQKSAQEFVPFLNVHYHRWQSGRMVGPPPTSQPVPVPPTDTPQPISATVQPEGAVTPTLEPTPLAPEVGGVIGDFDSGANEWVVFADTEKDTQLTCGRDEADLYSGAAGLRIEYDVAPDSWASCSLVYPSPLDWRDELGLAAYLHAERVGQQVIIVVYQGNSPDSLSHFELQVEANQVAVDGWQRVDIHWDQLVQPSWEGDGTARFDPSQTMGLAFLFAAPEGERNSGQFWVDDIVFLSRVPTSPTATPLPTTTVPLSPTATPLPTTTVPLSPTVSPPSVPTEVAAQTQPSATATAPDEPGDSQLTDEPGKESSRKGICPGSTVVGLVTLAGVVWAQRGTSFGPGGTWSKGLHRSEANDG